MNKNYIFFAIVTLASLTFLLRALPFLIFRENNMPAWLNRLGVMLPNAIMAVLIIYCLKDVESNWIGFGLLKLIAAMVVAISYKWNHKTLFSIAVGTISYMILIRIF